MADLTPTGHLWWHLDGTMCVGGWSEHDGLCIEGGGPVIHRAALEQVAALQQQLTELRKSAEIWCGQKRVAQSQLDKIEQAAREFLLQATGEAEDSSWGRANRAETQLRQVLDEIEQDRGGT